MEDYNGDILEEVHNTTHADKLLKDSYSIDEGIEVEEEQ